MTTKRRSRITERGLIVCVLAPKHRHFLGVSWTRRKGEGREFSFAVGDNEVTVSCATAILVARGVLKAARKGKVATP